VLETAATMKIVENKLPAAISDSERDCRTSGRAMPKVATIMDGMKFEQGTM
jgi:hypothetical protein